MGDKQFLVATVGLALLTIAFVPSVAGSVLPDEASAVTPPGIWTSDNADWALAPGDEDVAIEIETQDDGENVGGSVQVNMEQGTQIEDLEELSFDAYYEEGGCGLGSPRASFAVDTNEDGASDGNVWAYAGPPSSWIGCPLGVWQSHDLLDGEDRFSAISIGGSPGLSQDEAHDVAGENHEVLSVSIVWDSTWHFGPSLTYLTNICVNDYVLAQPGDEILSATGPGCE